MTIRVEHANTSSRIGLAIVVAALVALIAAPWWADRASLRLLSEIYAYVALASLWNLLAGYAGLVSVGQQAYVGLGAYVLFGLAMLAGVHPLAAIPFAGIAAAVVAVPVAALIFVCAGTISRSAPGWWPRCSGFWPRRSRRSMAVRAPACRQR
jgi:branched-chain amino acid transport system permease protein